MRFTLIAADRTVYVDGDPRVVDPTVEMPIGVAAVQWDGDSGEVEYMDKSKANKRIFDVDGSGVVPEPYRRYVNEHAKAKSRDLSKVSA